MANATLRIVLGAAFALGVSPKPVLAAQPPVMKLGQCARTSISWLGQRLGDAKLFSDVPDSGSAVKFANGLYQVSYEEVPELNNSRLGDPVSICLVELPTNCPPGDDRGKMYKTTNLRSRKSWTLPDSEHDCGGA